MNSAEDIDNKKKFESSIPSIEMAHYYIYELNRMDLSKITDKELSDKLLGYFPSIPYNNHQFIPAGMELYRARLDEGEEPFKLTKLIYMRESEDIEDYGRANRPHERTFYCSTNMKVAATEVIQNIPEDNFWHNERMASVTVGVWRVKKPLFVSNVFHGQKLHEVRKDIKFAYEIYQKQKARWKGSPHVRFVEDMLCDFFANQFTKEVKHYEEFNYKISALYSSLVRNLRKVTIFNPDLKTIDGIKYPSVAIRYKGDNLAIFHEAFMDGKMELIRAEQLICANTHLDKRNPLVAEERKSDSIKNGVIDWHPHFAFCEVKK